MNYLKLLQRVPVMLVSIAFGSSSIVAVSLFYHTLKVVA